MDLETARAELAALSERQKAVEERLASTTLTAAERDLAMAEQTEVEMLMTSAEEDVAEAERIAAARKAPIE